MTAPGWYPDPAGTPAQRWWDGAQWTQHVQQPAPAPLPVPVLAPAYAPPVAALVPDPPKVKGGRKHKFEGVVVDNVTISYKKQGGPVAGARATVETDGEVVRRFTATRLIALGPLALAFRKKKDRRELYLTVEGHGFAFVVECDPKKGAEARKFAATINAAAGRG